MLTNETKTAIANRLNEVATNGEEFTNALFDELVGILMNDANRPFPHPMFAAIFLIELLEDLQEAANAQRQEQTAQV